MNTTTIDQNANDIYDYPAAIETDIRDWLEENDTDGTGCDEDLRYECEQTVTGNDNGSYTCNAWLAAEHIRNSGFVLGDDWQDFTSWLDDLGLDIARAVADPETLDVLIRSFYFDRVWNDINETVF